MYPPNTDPTIIAGYDAQRKIILESYGSTTTSVYESAFTASTYLFVAFVKPLSRGSVFANTLDPLVQPTIDFNVLSNPAELAIILAAIRKNRDLVASDPMAELGLVEVTPGANVTTDDDLRAAVRKLLSASFYHPCGTCSMMKRAYGGVIAPDLKVYGVDGLSVVDGSIFPLIPAAHPSATVYAIAEKVSATCLPFSLIY